MNPPGIPMFYGSENAMLAIAEVRRESASVGRFRTTRSLRILDLADLPPTSGFFSTAERDDVLAMRFLHQFARLIVEPVERDDRTVLDYIPTQVFTEFLRDYRFAGGPIDGIRYRSATRIAGANVVLFATQDDVIGIGDDPSVGFLELVEAHEQMLTEGQAA